MHFLKLNFVLFCMAISISLISCKKEDSASIVIPDTDFNKSWLFQKDSVTGGETVDFDDSNWQKVTLPHDWSILGPFDKKYNARTGGLPVHGIGWYRKHFTIEKSLKGKQVSVEFDGAMSNARVYLNGKYIGERPYGYIGFEFDLTKYIKYGEDNIIAVRLAPEDLSMRWYAGAGIYRNVRLKINNSVHIPQWGTYITTPKVENGNAQVNITTTLKNSSNDKVEGSLITVIKDADGTIVSKNESTISIKANSEKDVSETSQISNVRLWDIYKSYLYSVQTSVKIRNNVVDEYESHFGVRTISFNAKDGFLLNGKKVRFNGVCMHHDLGPLGAGVNYRATERQMQIMKSMGVNALRTSHNPPSPEMLEVCDKLGIVVIDEAFDEWKIGKVPNGYHKYFDDWHEKDLRDMIKRDRNHPSVIMWSIGNEILEQGKKDGWKLTKHLSDICHDQDNSRPTTAGFNFYPAPFINKLANYVDVVGMNYWPTTYSRIAKENPEMIVYGSETSSQTSSRGIYHLPIEFKEKHETNHVSSYDVTVGPPWAYAPDIEFDAQEQQPNSLGEFVWTGFDYLGEPTPYGGRDNSTNGYWNDDWPSRSSYFAPVDLCGFPKDRYYLYQSQWTTEPMVHLLPHWNWEGMEGKTIPVFSYTNCDEVELFVNGKSFGKKVKGKDFTEIPSEYHEFEKGMYKTKYRLSWNVPYQPGSIKVVAYKNGKEATSKEIKTAGKPAQIKLEADRNSITANGKDLSFITVSVLDKNGNICPKADNLIQFKIEGAGVLAAVGNGDQTSLASFRVPQRKAFSGKCLLIVKSEASAGIINIKASSDNLSEASIKVETK